MEHLNGGVSGSIKKQRHLPKAVALSELREKARRCFGTMSLVRHLHFTSDHHVKAVSFVSLLEDERARHETREPEMSLNGIPRVLGQALEEGNVSQDECDAERLPVLERLGRNLFFFEI